ncbi:hypothetical protein ACFUTV_40990 [Streptomyces sp. NPDC057298]|uniref:hypothetical protein n=1 Tax=Streptomyces sp. NPDC057298 TaxID=3346091 RepID=UPI00362AB929
MPFLLRIALIALVVIAVLLASRADTEGRATIPSPTTTTTIPARTPAPDTP